MKIRNWMMVGVLTLASVLMLTLPVSAVTCPAGTNRQGSLASTLAECNIENDNSLIPTILNIIQVTIGVLALVAVIVIVFAGVQYTTSAGDAGKVKKAKDSILYGIVGLVIAILAFAIVNFVLSSLTKKPTTDDNSNNNSTTNVKDKDDGGKAKVIDSENKEVVDENKEAADENKETNEVVEQIVEAETRLNSQLEEAKMQRKRDLALLEERRKEIDGLDATKEKKQELRSDAQKEYDESEWQRKQKIESIKREFEAFKKSLKKQKAQK